MSLLGSLFGDSRSSTQTSTSNVQNTQLAGGNIAAPTAYGTGNVIQTSDVNALNTANNAFAAATDVGSAALGLGAVAINATDHVAQTALDQGFNFGSLAIDSVSKFSGAALDSNTYVAGKSLDALSASFSDSLATTANANAKALNSVEGLAAQVSQSSQQTTDQTVQHLVLYAAIAAVAIFVLPKVLK